MPKPEAEFAAFFAFDDYDKAHKTLYGMVTSFSPAYLPSDYTYYSIILTFVILAVVLAVRPNGLFGRKE